MSNEKSASAPRAHALFLMLALLGAPATALAATGTDAAATDAAAQDAATSAPHSAAPARDPFLAPPLPPSDSALPPETAPMEAVRLSTQGRFTDPSPRVGDSLDYVVEAEWDDTQVPVVVLAPDSVDFPGFKVIGQATVHKKLAGAASVRNHTEFVFRLRAQTQGPGKAASMKLRYLTGMSRAEEAVFIPTALADIRPAPVRLSDRLWFKALMVLAILGGAIGLGLAGFRFAARKRAEKMPRRDDLTPAVAALKNRLRSAQNSPDASKEILLEMERLAALFLRDEIEAAGGTAQSKKPADAPGASASATAPRFEPLLAAYLASHDAQSAAAQGAAAQGAAAQGAGAGGTAQEWTRLGELFKHARFAGGYKEPHELQDAFRTFRKCLKITGEDQHE